MTTVVQEIVIDCAEPAGLARFWAQVLEARWALVHPGWVVVDAAPLIVAFQQVPEPKSSPKNRLHLDVRVVTGLVGAERVAALEAECERLETLGARRVQLLPADGVDESCLVMQDVEGNEFCLD